MKVFSLKVLLISLPVYIYTQSFSDVSLVSGFDDKSMNNGIAVGDYNNDGFEDIYVCNREGKNLFYENLGNGQFDEKASMLGIDFNGKSNTSIWLDFDNDGDQDLYVGNYDEANILYRNEGDVFTDVTQQFNLGTIGRISSLNAGDFDMDGDLDIYVANFNEKNKLYRNEGAFFI
ncbi:MAG: VCBS repeat-containing protein, partial [Bacteroidia bacterium]|nr:VCBS repeat-containing protein [Bacteroidia bacterium]